VRRLKVRPGDKLLCVALLVGVEQRLEAGLADDDAAPEAALDFSGYNFWLAKLEQFNGDFVKAEMVKAFITSDEYLRRFGM